MKKCECDSGESSYITKLARAMITRYGMSKDFDMVAMETITGDEFMEILNQ